MAKLRQLKRESGRARPADSKSLRADRGNGTKSAPSGFIIKDTPRAN
jgi:hypothetical protein